MADFSLELVPVDLRIVDPNVDILEVTGSLSLNVSGFIQKVIENQKYQEATMRLEKARKNAYSRTTNQRNLESPWALPYRIFLGRTLLGIPGLDVENRLAISAWHDDSRALPVDLVSLPHKLGTTVKPNLDVVLWGRLNNLYPVLWELKPSVTREWLDSDGNPLHIRAARQICQRLLLVACPQVELQALALFRHQEQTKSFQQDQVMVKAAVGDWFTSRTIFKNTMINIPETDLDQRVQAILSEITSLAVALDLEEQEEDTTENAESDALDFISQYWGMMGVQSWSVPCRLRTKAAEGQGDSCREFIQGFANQYSYICN